MKYRVRIYGRVSRTKDVEAANEEEAISKAEAGHNHNFDWGTPTVEKGKGEVIMSGPVGEPLIRWPEEWQIYSTDDFEKPAKKVNAEITKAVKAVCAEILAKKKAKEDVGVETCRRLYKEHVYPVFKKYHKFGTFDSEPRGAVAGVIASYAGQLGYDREKIDEAVYYAV